MPWWTLSRRTPSFRATRWRRNDPSQSWNVGAYCTQLEARILPAAVSSPIDSDIASNSIPELAKNGSTVGITVFASDPDGTNNAVTYSLIDSANGRFAINPTTGVVTVAKSQLLDREAAAAWNITVRATSQDGSTSAEDFSIALTDVNDNRISAVSDVNAAVNIVSENAANGTLVGITASAIDADVTNNAVTYSLTKNAGGRFKIDAATGVVSVANGTLLDREQAAAWSITVLAKSQDGSSASKSFSIALSDVDEFDIGPLTDVNQASDQVAENSKAGKTVGLTLRAVDADSTSVVTYSLTDNAGGRFSINPTTGVVSVAKGAILDYETLRSHSITVQAESSDGSVTGQTYVINVTNVDDAPRITLSRSTVAENSAIGTVVGTLGTADLTATSPVYTLVSGSGATDNSRFTISGTQLQTAAIFDFEAKSSYSIRVQVTATGVFHVTVLTIQVTNLAEAPTGLSLSQASIAEGNAVGASIGTLHGIDSDTGETFTYSLVPGTGSTDNAKFTITGSDLKAAIVFDYETKKSYSIRVRVTDSSGQSYETIFTIKVTKVPVT